MSVNVRTATPDDAAGVLEIYRPIVLDTAITFELEVPSCDEMAGRIERALNDYAWIIAEREGRVLGYAYAGMLRLRAAYRQAVETSVYLHEDARGQGLAQTLYGVLFDALRGRDFHTAIAGITLPNDPSVLLHERLGFSAAGRFREVGRKFDRWHDVGWWQRML